MIGPRTLAGIALKSEVYLIIAAGEILVDIFPQYSRIGGAPFNFAYHAKHLGMDVRLITRIGKDETGSWILSRLEKSGFDTDFIQIDNHHETGRVIVTPDEKGGHEFEILRDSAYDYIQFPDKPPKLPDNRTAGLIYFGTLAQRTPSGFNNLQTFLSKRQPEMKCFYDINLRRDNYSDAIIKKSLETTDILKLNTEEIEYLRSIFNSDTENTTGLARWLIQHFDIEMVSLTKGANGSEIITMNNHETTGVIDFEIVDTVGAGDAYATIVAIGYLKKIPLNNILSIANAFSAAICQIKGAVPEDPQFYEPFLKKLAGATDV